LINRIRAYVEHSNTNAEPFVRATTADEVLAKVRRVEISVKHPFSGPAPSRRR
jgi:hypothetical protein